jgi:hypothetical protein
MTNQVGEHIPVEELPYAKELVTCLPYAESRLRQTCTIAIGAGSACWDTLEGAGVFQSERAVEITKKLIDEIIEITAFGKANLGCATTQELADELQCRVSLGHIDPGYKTVDG